jgi:SAM-dependent methyltransferase
MTEPNDDPTLYDQPLYYDIAFTWPVTAELDFLAGLFEELIPGGTRQVLEPACGPGRLLRGLARRGYTVLGYDTNPRMAAYAAAAIEREGLDERAAVVEGAMETFRPPGCYGAAVNVINSLGYLQTDGDIRRHFALIAAALKPGGLYVVQLSCAWDGPPRGELSSWTCERNGVRVETTWSVEREEPERRLSHQRCRMVVDDHGRRLVLDEPHLLRLWYFDELVALARGVGLTLRGVYAADFSPTAADGGLCGADGNQYFVFARERT